MVHDTVEREEEQKNLHTQIQSPSLTKSWVEVWREQERCDEERRIRVNGSGESVDGGVNLLEKIPWR